MAPSPQQAAKNFPSGLNLMAKTSDVFSVMVIAGWRQRGVLEWEPGQGGTDDAATALAAGTVTAGAVAGGAPKKEAMAAGGGT